MHIDESQLESFITDSGLASKEEMEKAKEVAKENNVSVGSILINKGILSVDDLRRMQAYTLGIPFVDLKNQKRHAGPDFVFVEITLTKYW